MYSLEEKGIPSPRVLIPAVFLILLLAAGYFLIPSAVVKKTQDLSLIVATSDGTPLAKMDVVLLADSEEFATGITDADGYVKFQKVPENAKLTVEISDPNGMFADYKGAVSLPTGSIKLSSLKDSGSPLPFTIWVTDSSTDDYLQGALVAVVYDDGSRLERSTDYRGSAEFDLEGSPTHLTIKASARNYKDAEKSVAKQQIESGIFYVELVSDSDSSNDQKTDPNQEDPIYGKVQVILGSISNEQLENIQVSVIDALTYRRVQTGKTDSVGSILFEDLRIGKEYAIEVAESAGYLGKSSEAFRLSSFSSVLEVSLDLEEKKNGDFIDLEVATPDGPAEYAWVNVFDSNGAKLKTDETDSDGKLSLLVSRDAEYYITVYLYGYLPVSFYASSSPTPVRITLKPETEDNSGSLSISVVQDSERVERAEIALFNSDGRFLGLPTEYTDMEGVAEFTIPREIDGSPYKLFAVAQKDSYAGRSATISSDFAQALQINLVGAPAIVLLELRDALTKRVLEAGKVSAIDEGGAILTSCDIVERKCELGVPSNTEFTLVAISGGYLQTTSDPMELSPSEIRPLGLQLVSQADATGVKTSFIGVYGAKGEAKELGNAESYIAKFLVTFPSASDIAGFHLHLSSPGNFVEIKSVDAAYQSLFTASSYASDNCYSGSSDNGSIGSFDILFPKGATGSREVSVRFFVRADAPASSSFAFNFRAYSIRKGIVLAYPAGEDQMEIPESTTPADAVKLLCATKNANQQFKVTSSPLICTDNGKFCRKIGFDKRGDIPLGTDFTLNFEVLSQEQIDTISVGSGNLKLTGSSVGTGFAGIPEDQIAAVTIPANIKTPGVLKFYAAKAGQTDLQLKFLSEKGTYTYHQNLRVTGENLMRVSVSPLTLITAEEKKITIRALTADDSPITDALVTLYDCEGSPLAAEEPQVFGSNDRNEGADGRYVASVNPMAFGKIGVRITHPEYKTYDECLVVINIDEDSLTVSPTGLQLKGDSTKTIEEELMVSTAIDAKSSLSLLHDCATSTSPVIYADPNEVSNFRDYATFLVGILPNLTIRKTCNLIVQQRFTKSSSISRTVPIRIDVQGPSIIDGTDPDLPGLPSPEPDGDPSPQAPGELGLPPTIELRLDEIGFRNRFFNTVGIGDPLNCEIIGPQDLRVSVECSPEYVSLTANYIGEAITRSYRQKGQLKITLAGEPAYFNILVTAPHAPADSQTRDSINNYPDLPSIPNPIVIELDPYTRRYDLVYSLGAFGEPVTSCSVQELDYGLTTEYCGPVEQKVRLVADFSSYDIYERLLSRIYGNNPACMNYYGQLGYGNSYAGQSVQNFGSYGQYGNNYPNTLQGNLYGSYGSNSQNYLGGGVYGNYNYGSQPYNQFSNGNYPVPQYQNGYVDYGNYPYMNSLQQPYQYPAPPNNYNNLQSPYSISYGIGSGSYDPQFSAINCGAGSLEGSIVFILKSGRRETIPVRIIAKGGSSYLPIMPGAQQIPCYGCNNPLPQNNVYQNEILQSQAIELDPFSLKRYAQYEISGGSGGLGSPLCTSETDPKYFEKIRSNLNYNPTYQTQSFNPFTTQPSQSGKFKDALANLDCDSLQNDLQIKLQADVNKISIPRSSSDYLNKEEELYLKMGSLSPARIVLAPIRLSIGDVEDYGIEPLSQNLQFIIAPDHPGVMDVFKKTDDIFSEENCKVTGIEGAEAETSPLGSNDGGFRSRVSLTAEFKQTLKYTVIGEAADAKLEEAKDGEAPAEGTDDTKKTYVILPKLPTSASLKCDTVKGSVSSKLHFAAVPNEITIVMKAGEKPTFPSRLIPFIGEIQKQDPKKDFNCLIESSSFASEFKDAMAGKGEVDRDNLLSCKISENSITFTADYTKLKKLGDDYSKLEDTLKLTLYSTTAAESSKSVEKEIFRKLVEISVKIVPPKETVSPPVKPEDKPEDTLKPGEVRPGIFTPTESNVYSLGNDKSSVCFGAYRPAWKHQGIDLGDNNYAAKDPVPIHAVAAGTVVFAGRGSESNCIGNYVIIEHAGEKGPYYTLYGHLSQIDSKIKKDLKVEANQIIGKMGESSGDFCGETIGFHLHFEACTVLKAGGASLDVCQNPCAFLEICPKNPAGVVCTGGDGSICSKTGSGSEKGVTCENTGSSGTGTSTGGQTGGIPTTPPVKPPLPFWHVEKCTVEKGAVLGAGVTFKVTLADPGEHKIEMTESNLEKYKVATYCIERYGKPFLRSYFSIDSYLTQIRNHEQFNEWEYSSSDYFTAIVPIIGMMPWFFDDTKYEYGLQTWERGDVDKCDIRIELQDSNGKKLGEDTNNPYGVHCEGSRVVKNSEIKIV
ncbi:MAG: peptidoglycan DD-metalloendopeptidase family protein [Candidatus Micrarchaeota archaeon]